MSARAREEVAQGAAAALQPPEAQQVHALVLGERRERDGPQSASLPGPEVGQREARGHQRPRPTEPPRQRREQPPQGRVQELAPSAPIAAIGLHHLQPVQHEQVRRSATEHVLEPFHALARGRFVPLGEVAQCPREEALDTRLLVEAPDEGSTRARPLSEAGHEALRHRRLSRPPERHQRHDALRRPGRGGPLRQGREHVITPDEVACPLEGVGEVGAKP
jgi:hypothetical protein